MDGEIVIGTKIDLKGIDKDLATLEKRLEELDKKAKEPMKMKFDYGEIPVTGTSGTLTDEEIKEYDELVNQIEILEAKKAEMLTTDEKITNQVEKRKKAIQEENINHDTTATKLTGLLTQLDAYVNEYQKLSKEKIVSDESAAELEKIKSKIKQIVAEYEKLSGKKLVVKGITDTKNDLPQIKRGVDDLGKGLKKVTQKAKQWALAIFGVRSAYMLIRNAMNVLTAGDEQLKADIDYIKIALASALEPIIRGIVDLVKKLLMYIGYIINAWTGINIFENANKNLEKANGSAKELKKTVTGFDEMNVLQDDKSKENASPSFDLTEGLPQGEVPGWLQWLADNGELVKQVIEGIGAAIVGLKLADLLKTLGLFENLKLWQLAAGIGLIIYGIIEFIQDIIDFLKDPTWEKFGEILTDIGFILAGLALIIGNIPLAVIAAVAIIVGTIISNWDAIMELLGKVGSWIYEHVIKPVADFFVDLWDNIWSGLVTTWNMITNLFSKGGQIFNGLKDGIAATFKTIVNTLIKGINKIIKIPFDKINGLLNTIRNINIFGAKPFKGLWKKNPLPVPQIPKLAMGGIVNMPGRGVMVGNAIAGERGAEGVIPLTNSQQMELIGQAIGKYVTINANITNSMNGRVISRELQKIQNENNFAFNR